MTRVRRGGFSLVEIVIVLFLTGLILACVASLTDRTFKTLKFLQEKSKTLESATLACERLASELREAVTAPSEGETVTFQKVIPSEAFGVGNLPGTDPSAWTRAYASSKRARISYSRDGERVRRQVDSEPPLEVANEVNAFRVDLATDFSPGNYKIVLSIKEDRRVVVFETYANCPGVPR